MNRILQNVICIHIQVQHAWPLCINVTYRHQQQQLVHVSMTNFVVLHYDADHA